MTVTQKIKDVISKNGSADEIKSVALLEGMNTLQMSAAKLVADGITSLSEMERIAFDK